MEKNHVIRLAKILKILVTITFVCNLIMLPLVPTLVTMGRSSLPLYEVLAGLPQAPDVVFVPFICFILLNLQPESVVVLTVFLWFCGSCTAVLLWQGRRVLDTILRENTFCFENARNLSRAAVCSFLISGAALVRTIWELTRYRSPVPLFTYNALFCPVALMGGLLCMVMSALFRQAAALKEENDLTI